MQLDWAKLEVSPRGYRWLRQAGWFDASLARSYRALLYLALLFRS